MFEFTMKNKFADVEEMMDDLISNPMIIIKNKQKARKLGQIAKPLRDEKILHISPDKVLNESVAFLKCNNVIKPNSVVKHKGKHIKYEFDSLLHKNKIY